MKRDGVEVYRVEDSDCRGMYRNFTCADCQDEMQDTAGRHPTAYRDAVLSNYVHEYGDLRSLFGSGEHRFGFKSLDQLKAWIYDQRWRDELEAKGFVISHLKANTYVGDTQCIFDPTTRVDLGQIKWSEL